MCRALLRAGEVLLRICEAEQVGLGAVQNVQGSFGREYRALFKCVGLF